MARRVVTPVAGAGSPAPPNVVPELPGVRPSPDAALPPDSKVFHAGTGFDGQGNVVTSGGRVLCACALGNTVGDAQRAAYAAVDGIHWEGEFHRSDIGWRALGR